MYKLVIIITLLQVPFREDFRANYKSKRVCIIGAGITGLTIAKYLRNEGINFIVLEATQYVGGTWRYDPRTGRDENGLPLHTSMYENLRTNLPKPVMTLQGFPLPDSLPSYPLGKDYYQYLQEYAKQFTLISHIMFLHIVTLVKRENNKWRVKYKHVITKEMFEENFDYLILGNGHYTTPSMLNITGANIFKGTIIHSHDYRTINPYKDRRVLVVGAGPSGMDIATDLLKVSKYLIHSHHRDKCKMPDSPKYVTKLDINYFNETGAVFKDNTYEEVDDVIFCTGYNYNFSFLDESCGLTFEPRFIFPLHQYMVNIREPTMIIMGLVTAACVVVTIDAQARYVTALIRGDFKLPTEYQMMQEWEKQMTILSANNLSSSLMHILGDKEDDYYSSLTEESGIDRVPPVIFKIRLQNDKTKCKDFHTFREYEYAIIDEQTFSRRSEGKFDAVDNVHRTNFSIK